MSHAGDTSDSVLFRSRKHPGDQGRAAVFGGRLVKPLGASMTPVMLGALTYMLTGRDPIGFLYFGFPVALALAAAWTVFQLLRRVAEVEIRGEAVRIRSVWEVASNRSTEWASVLDVGLDDGELTVTLGHDSRRLRTADFANPAALNRGLAQAAERFTGRVQERLS